MPHIQVLPELLVRQIAAGECIERPASVVKELVENSLDAGATRIEIDIEEAGSQLIKISDDGCGIGKDELSLALASHATSKLHTLEDLHAIHTFGFRGEALASICAVAEVSLASATAESPSGYVIESKGDNLLSARPIGMAQGTTVTVRNLFFNVPARRKFLKSKNVEMGHISDVVTCQAISAYRVAFQLSHNKKPVFTVARASDAGERIRDLLGGKLDAFWHVEAGQDAYRLEAYIQNPQSHKADTKWQFFYVNNRYVRDRVATRALEDAYKDYLPERRHPVAVMFLHMDPASVDVNVHPAKAEVRYRDGQEIYRVIHKHILAALRQHDMTPEIPLFDGSDGRPAEMSQAVPADTTQESHVDIVPDTDDKSVSEETVEVPPASRIVEEIARPFTKSDADCISREQTLFYARPLPSLPAKPPATTTFSVAQGEQLPARGSTGSKESLFPTAATKDLRFWQVHDSYIVAEVAEGLLIVDQHALHERMLYEKLRRQVAQGKIVSQPLLFPEKIRVTASEMAILQEWRQQLHDIGLDIEPCGNGEVAIARLPQLVAKVSGSELLQTLLTQIGQTEHIEVADALDQMLATMACKAAVKAGDALTHEEIASLMRAPDIADNPFHCPHGRPTVLKITLAELEKHFKRR
jgi:DNA mismatch repair protein MutL